MKKSKYYHNVKFSARVVEEAHDLFLSQLDTTKEIRKPTTMEVTIGNEIWNFDTRQEFLSEYLKADDCMFSHSVQECGLRIYLESDEKYTSVTVEFLERSKIESIFQVFERNLNESKIVTESEPLTIFIGHGHNPQWRDLKDHLHEKQGLNVNHYEIGPRAGKSIKEVLEEMLDESSFALLVLTGEDIHINGELHARENIIHELGLFQGRLGFTRAIILLEEDVQEFSNILGVNQIRFAKGRIEETFGEILATIRREFKNNR
ncbi:nucleotide-binding protein [Patescibacteria group bacterium]|nr:nucleotide-binding protein [Patescibacteria group bacterium]